MTTVRNAIVEAHREINRLSGPDEMTKHQYKEFLEELIGDLESWLDAVKDELKHEQD